MLFHIALVAGVNDKPLHESMDEATWCPTPGPHAEFVDVSAVDSWSEESLRAVRSDIHYPRGVATGDAPK